MSEDKRKQLLKQIASAIFTFAIYTSLVSWKAAMLIMVGIGFHEYGHIWAANHVGLKTKGFYFMPFLGGAAILDTPYKRYSQQSFTVLMGPIWGGALSFGAAGLYYYTGDKVWAGAAQWMAFINMFNLFPLAFLDGGQLLDTVSYSLSDRLGLICKTVSTTVAVPIIFTFNPVIAALVAVIGFVSLRNEYREYTLERAGRKYNIQYERVSRPDKLTTREIILTLSVYGALLISLVWLSTAMTKINSTNLVHLFD